MVYLQGPNKSKRLLCRAMMAPHLCAVLRQGHDIKIRVQEKNGVTPDASCTYGEECGGALMEGGGVWGVLFGARENKSQGRSCCINETPYAPRSSSG